MSEEVNMNEEQKGVQTVEEDAAKKEAAKSNSEFAYTLQKYLGWIFLYFISYLLILAGQLLGMGLVTVIDGIMKGMGVAFVTSDVWVSAEMYLMFIGIWIVVIPTLALGKRMRPILKTLWTDMPGNTVKGFLLGAAIGGGANAFCILIAWLHQDIKLYYDSFQPLPLLFLLIAVLIQSAAEELVCRAYLYQKLMRLYRKNFWVSAILNSLLFSLLHLGNDGVTVLSLINIFLSGIMFTLMVYCFNSLWAAFAGHMAWNYTQNIIFGLPNSGNVVPYSIFKLDASTAMDSFAYNVGFGIEGTVVADIVLLVICVAIYFWYLKKKKAA